MTQIVVSTQIATASGKPISVTATSHPIQFHSSDHQNVRISHEKWDSVHVPRASPRVM